MKLVAESAGVVSAVYVQAGEVAEAGTVLIATELMKMLTEVTAPTAARVLEVHVAVGDTIETGTVLATLE
ncbi:MAG: biotin/lipoyl-containing protein, partial [Pseudomonadota bacterium]